MSRTPSIDSAPSECAQVANAGDYVNQILERQAAEAFEDHLAECEICQGAVQDEQLFCELKDAFVKDPSETWDAGENRTVDGQSYQGKLEFAGYEVNTEIHRGGQGVVYDATQLATNRQVALKVILHGTLASKRQQQRFEREIDLVAQLKHPNIVTIFDSGMNEGRHYYAMQYIDGVPLDQFIDSEFPLLDDSSRSWSRDKLSEALRLFREICDAVAYAHQHGVIHRDLKPANILVDQLGKPHVVDFGLAKAVDQDSQDDRRHTATGEFLGTLAYASPEQARGNSRQVDIRSDVYSLGVILYELLTSRLPYDVRGSLGDVISNIISMSPESLTRINRRIDHELETIVLKSLSKEPERRYQSAEHLARDLDHYLNGQPIDAKRDSTWYVLRKSLRRYRAVVVSAAAFVLVIAVSLAVSLMFWRQAVIDRDAAIESGNTARRAGEEAALAWQEEERQRQEADLQRTEAEVQSYIANVAAAGRARQMYDVTDSWKKLEQAPERFRGWEWFHFVQLLDDSREMISTHKDYVEDVSISPNGRWIASACWDGKLHLRDAENDDYYDEYEFGGPVWRCEFGPNNRWLAIGIWDHSVALVDLESLDVVHYFKVAGKAISDLAFSPSGELLAASYHTQDTKPLQGERGVSVWGVESRELETEIPLVNVPRAIGFSPDGETLVMAVRGLQVRNARTGAMVKRVSVEPSGTVAVSQDGLRVATSNGPQIQIWDIESASKLKTIRGHGADIYDIEFGPNDSHLVSCSRDKTIRIWDSQSGEQLRVLCGHSWVITSLAISHDGQKIVSGSWDQSVRIWDGVLAPRRDLLEGHTDAVNAVAFSVNHVLATASVDQSIRLWHLATRECLGVLEGHQAGVLSVAFHPEGRLLASGSADGLVNIWDIEAQELVTTLRGHDLLTFALSFSPDGQYLVSGSADNTLIIWDVETYQQIETLTGHTDHIHVGAFGPKGKWIATGGHESIRVWDAVTHVELASFPRTMIGDDHSLAFHPDGTRLAAGSNVNTITVWGLADMAPLRELSGHTDEIHSVAFNATGSRLASASFDNSVKIWDVDGGRELTTLFGHPSHVKCVAFGPSGFYLVAGLESGQVKIWEGKVEEPLKE